jgi:predicted enzyme related to lactoylglutathione lyase
MHESLPNTIDYIEMPSRNLGATKEFFAGLLGWSFQDYGPEYSSFDDGRMTGGFFASEITSTVAQGGPLIVFYSADLETIAKDVARLGGRITRDIFEFPGGRRFHFEAPGGGEFAIWSEK